MNTPLPAGLEARQSMIRVWLAISAVWVAFWLAIALVILTTVDLTRAFGSEFSLYGAVVLAPPLALLALGVLGRWAFETLRLRRGQSAC
jgi:hypothetical protein